MPPFYNYPPRRRITTFISTDRSILLNIGGLGVIFDRPLAIAVFGHVVLARGKSRVEPRPEKGVGYSGDCNVIHLSYIEVACWVIIGGYI
ncbi:MAG TPA: hypothetical protein VGP82_26010 [Ktedonobacterales bacterium]|jgi:hypothetical protein|nr:hypothetical protein [Ktedonobacterales bacterium]